MTFRKPVGEDFPGSRLGNQAYAVYKDKDGCDDGKPEGWSPCIMGDGTPCNFYGKKECYHGQGVEKRVESIEELREKAGLIPRPRGDSKSTGDEGG